MRHRVFGRTRKPRQPGSMNREESSYALFLEARKRAGEIADYAFEPEKFRLADKTFYTPDFRIVLPDGLVEFHEVKAYWAKAKRVGWEDDARVKIKVAAELHPYHFVAAWKHKENGYEYERFAEGQETGP